MEQGLFFPSKNGDRKYKASDFTGYFSKLFSNGVFSNNSKNLQVIASATNGLSLIVEAGYGNINGYLYQLSEPKTVVFNIADVSGTAKKGSVVLRMDLTERKMTVEAKGTDDLTRNATVYELMLARILIPGNGKPITQGMIQDTRGDGNVCGFVSSLIDIDPTTLWTQFEADWNEWLTEIKGTVGDDAAANLALVVDNLKKSVYLKEEVHSLLQQKAEITVSKNEIKYIAHRGLSSVAPENTIAAFEKSKGAYGCETDIQVTSDGHWVCMHDDTIDRMTNGSGKIADLTLAQLKQFKIDAGNNVSKYAPLSVPTLEEYLLILKQVNVVPIIEVKRVNNSTDYKNLISIIKEYQLETSCIIISFDFSILKEIRNLSESIQLQFLVNKIDTEVVKQCLLLGKCDLDCIYTALDQTALNIARENKLKINAWTVNQKESEKSLIKLGVDFITTDNSLYILQEELLLENNWKPDSPQVLYMPSVVEISPHTFLLRFAIAGGIKTKGTLVTVLPEYARPNRTIWSYANIRNAAQGVVAGTVDINSNGMVTVGLNWDKADSWIGVDTVYSTI
ncbi:glycerophosphodiester phosphodiesterase family protein [Carnobacterium divergens]|uniref:glycerophosphodiester phosphodiesterase family protein n=1 Tax=Carnobacterium divergens TaxID=2748 RepID=UPI002890049E|nr:glycerophosphodiester phosphodiesterase family protein [Carnobacterium divergens]MDT2010586.1 hypothetical protein [Carnobacterium divergens]